MKKNISNEKTTKEIIKWIDSFTKEEWRKKLEEEKYLYELDKEHNLEWLNNDAIAPKKLLNSINCGVIRKDVRDFDYTSLNTPISNKESSELITYEEIVIDSEAA